MLASRRDSSIGDLVQRQILARAGRALDREVVAVVVVELLERLDDQVVDREPDRAAPVRVAAEQAAVRLGRLVLDACSACRRPPACTGGPRGSARARARRTARGTRSRPASACSTRFMRWPRRIASSRRSPMPGSCQRETSPASSGRCSRNHSSRASERRAAARAAPARSWSPRRAGSGRPSSGPCSGDARAVAGVEHVVEELVLLVPERDAVVADVVHRLAMYRKCSKNLVAMSS